MSRRLFGNAKAPHTYMSQGAGWLMRAVIVVSRWLSAVVTVQIANARQCDGWAVRKLCH